MLRLLRPSSLCHDSVFDRCCSGHQPVSSSLFPLRFIARIVGPASFSDNFERVTRLAKLAGLPLSLEWSERLFWIAECPREESRGWTADPTPTAPTMRDETPGLTTSSGAYKMASTTTTSNSCSRRDEERSASWKSPLIE